MCFVDSVFNAKWSDIQGSETFDVVHVSIMNLRYFTSANTWFCLLKLRILIWKVKWRRKLSFTQYSPELYQHGPVSWNFCLVFWKFYLPLSGRLRTAYPSTKNNPMATHKWTNLHQIPLRWSWDNTSMSFAGSVSFKQILPLQQYFALLEGLTCEKKMLLYSWTKRIDNLSLPHYTTSLRGLIKYWSNPLGNSCSQRLNTSSLYRCNSSDVAESSKHLWTNKALTCFAWESRYSTV